MSNTQTIIDVNKAMESMLKKHLNKQISIRFDLPEIDAVQSDAAVSVFLYDIHEDLQLRTAEHRKFNTRTGTLAPGWVNIKCNYLITYWDASKPTSDATSPDSQHDNQAIQVMSQVLTALINNRQLEGLPEAYTQVIPPKENLNSLGNFWQSLGNRPRLSLNYCITVPIRLMDKKTKAKPVKSLKADIKQVTPFQSQIITDALHEQLVIEIDKGTESRLAMAHIHLDVTPVTTARKGISEMTVSLLISGITRKEYLSQINAIITAWSKSNIAVVSHHGCDIYIDSVSTIGLIGI